MHTTYGRLYDIRTLITGFFDSLIVTCIKHTFYCKTNNDKLLLHCTRSSLVSVPIATTALISKYKLLAYDNNGNTHTVL